MRVLVSWMLGPLAVVLGIVAATVAMVSATAASALLAAGMHMAAAALAIVASERRRGGLLPAERDAVWITALLVPCFGAALAWVAPRGRDAASLANAHEAFEHYEARVRPSTPTHDRTLLTGDHDPDVAREIDVRRHQRVLHAGTTVERLNALRCLVRLGRTRDMALVRAALADTEEEVRLFAHALLDGLMEEHGARIVATRDAYEQDPGDPRAQVALARAHFDLAASGALDARSARYHYRCAARAASREGAGRVGDDGDVERVRLVALASARTAEPAAAEAALVALTEDERRHPDVRLVIAEVAYLRRDLVRVRAEQAALAAGGHTVPAWLSALAGATETEAAA